MRSDEGPRNLAELSGADHPDGGLRRSANTPQVGDIFQKIGGGRNAFGGFGHPGGDLACPDWAIDNHDNRAALRSFLLNEAPSMAPLTACA